ncbi:MAG: MFS transporter [Candidatus Thermoplasmatota archaeon]|nr:MFS transporter [Candidatus Thermoplasmatota archaeon]
MENTRKNRPGSRILDALAISRDFSFLMLSLAVVSLGFGILSPIMPKYAEQNLSMDAAELGITYSLFALSFALGMIPAGYLTDRVGRKPLIIAGTLTFSVTTYALVLITTSWQFAILRVLEGLGAALVTPAAFALTIDLVPENKRGVAMGAEGTAQLLGGFGGPGLGGILAGQVGFYYPFYIAAGLAAVCAGVVFFIREPGMRLADEKSSVLAMFGAWKRNFQQNKALAAVTTRGFVMGIVQALWNLGLIYYWYDRLGMTETEVGIAISIELLAMLLATLPFGVMSDRHGRRPFILIGGALMVGGLLLNVWVRDVWQVFVLTAIAGFGGAMSNPSVGAMLADVMLPSERGRVMGAYQMIQGFGNIVGFFALGVHIRGRQPRGADNPMLCSPRDRHPDNRDLRSREADDDRWPFGNRRECRRADS